MNEQEYKSQVEKIDEQMKNLRKKKAEMKKKMDAENKKLEAIRNEKVYDAMHGFFTQRGITDEMIISMDAKTELREVIFGNPNQNQNSHQ